MAQLSGSPKEEDSPGEHYPPSRVSFPAAARRIDDPPSLKLQVEESAEDICPRNMWQVYALGGFMVLRWMWARWRERQGKPNSPDDPSA